MAIARLPGRPAERKELIKGSLRARVLDGQWPPGTQLPTRQEIISQFQASPGTVQSALEELRTEGFVEVRGRQGTFVSQNPPHLADYALVFPTFPGDRYHSWVRFWTALANEATALNTLGPRRIHCYYAVDEHHDSPDFHELTLRVRDHRLAGIIFASPPYLVENTSIVTQPGVTRVSISGPPRGDGMYHVTPDSFHFWEKAFAHLASRGKKQVAILNPHYEPGYLADIRQVALRHGVEVPDIWMQGVHVSAPDLARNLVSLLFHGRQDSRPEAFIVSDDNLLSHAIAGLQDAGITEADCAETGWLTLVAHCNFPWPVAAELPVTRLGFDAREVLLSCLHVVEAQRETHAAPLWTKVPARFEHDLQSAVTVTPPSATRLHAGNPPSFKS